MMSLHSFDLTGPLPRGVNALEASAGTGKTFALSALAVRYIAELSLHPSQLCLVSFTEAATAELRGRVRTKLVEALRHCEVLLAGVPLQGEPDPVLATIANPGMDPDLIRSRLTNLQIAVAEFDAATISTIHGFCQRVVMSAGDTDEARRITEGTEEIAEVVNDLLIAVAADPDQFGCTELSDILNDNLPGRLTTAVSKALSMPDARWFLGELPSNRKPLESQLRNKAKTEFVVGLVEHAVKEVQARRAQRVQTTFDGVIAATRDLLHGDRSQGVVRALRERFAVVLIDEFQDTDSVQWDIFRTAFITRPEMGPVPSVTIVGDPKQSIYRFRSAELSAYLSAVAAAGEQVATLDTNWRSDGDLLDGLENLMDGFAFGDERVRFHPVQTAPDLEGTRLIGSDLAPLEFRCVTGSDEPPPPSPVSRSAIRNDLVGVVAAHLSSEMMIRSRTPDANGDFAQRPIQPSDIAILTRSNSEASIVAADLAAAGIPAATASSQSVLDSEAAFQWQILLEAIGKPGSVGLVKAAALGWFFGLDSQAVDALDDVGIAGLQDRLRDWGRLLQERGLSALVHRARSEGVQARLLRGPTGERDLTDLDHVAEVLQSVSGGRPATAGVLLALLAEAASQSDDEGLAKDFLARRIDRDDHAVSVLTVHKSKGLEYPILLLPFMWTDSSRTRGLPHGVSSGVRYLDGTWIPDLKPTKLNEELRNQNRDEVAGEARRLLYVAMTRARHRCVIWWPEGTVKSPLADLFEHRLGSPAVDLSDLDPLVESSQGRISVVPVSIFTKAPSSVEGTLLDPALSVSEQADQSILGIRETTRVLDNSWRIWSFTGIVSAARARSSSVGIADVAHRIAEKTELMLGSGTDEAVLSDLLPADLSSTDLSSTDLSALGMPPEDLGFDNPEQETLELRSAPAGTVFGTLVHEVLEVVDFAAEDLVEQLQTECARRLLYRPMDITAERLATGLAQAVRAPLGGPLGMRRLVDLPRSDRVDEMDFFLPLGKITASDIGKVLVDHLAPDDPLLSWAQSLAGRDGETTGFDLDLQGRLTGSIDLTMRWMDPVNGQMRYWVADYKSNRLSEPATYRGPELFEAMVHHDYPLQAILYLVACHRYLRWKLPDYEPAQHLGGAAYLFLRGMDPRSVPDDVPDDAPGVAWWTPGAEAVCAVDELLARGAGHRGAEQS